MKPITIKPNWPAARNIHAFATTRTNGYSQAPYHHFNLATHVGDEPQVVEANRQLLKTSIDCPQEPRWLEQTHSCRVVLADSVAANCEADGSYSHQANVVCAVLTADCLPILISNRHGTEVAAIHAGWRGLAAGIIEQTLQCLSSKPQDLLVWLGPAISRQHFQVGDDVYQHFMQVNPRYQQAFEPQRNNKYLADIYQLARMALQQCQVTAIYGGEYCTYEDTENFFSYRRDGQTGRMASVIWFV